MKKHAFLSILTLAVTFLFISCEGDDQLISNIIDESEQNIESEQDIIEPEPEKEETTPVEQPEVPTTPNPTSPEEPITITEAVGTLIGTWGEDISDLFSDPFLIFSNPTGVIGGELQEAKQNIENIVEGLFNIPSLGL